ncbi:MAG TPA: hypothetical protein ENG13_00365, partial [bacterium]|nr:hypothetical protein [bacterium]HEX67507.1 hypothetical protein [bacterium]
SPESLWRGKEKIDLSFLYGREIISLCAIGDPGYFEETLEKLGAKIKKRLRFPDHYPFHKKGMWLNFFFKNAMVSRSMNKESNLVITTKSALFIDLQESRR